VIENHYGKNVCCGYVKPCGDMSIVNAPTVKKKAVQKKCAIRMEIQKFLLA